MHVRLGTGAGPISGLDPIVLPNRPVMAPASPSMAEPPHALASRWREDPPPRRT